MRSTCKSWFVRRGWIAVVVGAWIALNWAAGTARPVMAQPGDIDLPDAVEPIANNAETPGQDVDPAAEPVEGAAPVEDQEPVEVEEVVVKIDLGAQLYMTKCMGCHTLGGGALTGPDLAPTLAWPRENLVVGIVRMEEKVGPMSGEEVDRLIELLQSGEAQTRLAAERQRVALAEAATLEPGNARIGQALFHHRALQNQGLSCSACHQVLGRGGNFAPDLTNIFDKLGEPSLQSACEGANFPVMREVYADHPVTKQEARHLVAYLKEVADAQASNSSSSSLPLLVQLLGAVGCLGVFGLVGLIHIRQRPSVRRSMIRDSHKGETQ